MGKLDGYSLEEMLQAWHEGGLYHLAGGRRHKGQCLESAGINRQEAEDENPYEKGVAIHSAPNFCAVCREACSEA